MMQAGMADDESHWCFVVAVDSDAAALMRWVSWGGEETNDSRIPT